MKICKDCKHYEELDHPVLTTPYRLCHHPELVGPVSGEPTDCKANREFMSEYCGRKGVYWEPKDA